MKKINVTIKGETSLLMNSPKGMLEPEEEVKSRLTKRNPVEEAEKLAYRTKEGKLYIPSAAIKGCMINASSFKKSGKYALKPIIAGGVRIFEEEIVLDTNKYDIDLRTVVIQRNRIVKARPKINKWEASFTILYNEEMISNPEIIKQILKEGGERVGILDFRPQKSGDFGTFKVTKFEAEKGGIKK